MVKNIMDKRRKWKANEDLCLQKVMQETGIPFKWD